MNRQQLRARAKTVQKLGQDGLVEQNKATGEEKRISQRITDISFGPDRTTEQAAGHRAARRTSGDTTTSGKKRRKQPRPVQQTAEEAVWASAPEPETPSLTPDTLSMRMAVDTPMIVPTVANEEPPPPPVSKKRRKRKNRKKTTWRQTAKHTPNAAQFPDSHQMPKPVSMRSADDVPVQNRLPGENRKAPCRPVEGGRRLKFEPIEGEKPPVSDAKGTENAKQKLKKKQVGRFTQDAAQTTVASGSRPVRLMDDGGERLRFDGTTDTAPVSSTKKSVKPAEIKRAAKKRQVLDYAANTVKMEDGKPTEASIVSIESTADTYQLDNTFFQDEPQESPAINIEHSIPIDGGGTDTRSRDSPPPPPKLQYATAKPDKPHLHFKDTPPA